MKILVLATALTFASFAHADQVATQDQQQDMAAVCQAEMDGAQALSPACEARLSCVADGVTSSECQAYCAQYPTDTAACNATVNAEMSRRWHHRRWHRRGFCLTHPFAPGCL